MSPADANNKNCLQQCPGNFTAIYAYLKGLEYSDLPNYEFIDKKFHDVLSSKKYELKIKFANSHVETTICLISRKQ